MPNCVVKGCKNQSSIHKKQDGITFHTFPNRDENVKEMWIAVIRDSRDNPVWQPSSRSVVCSTHFKSDDLYYTIKGLRRIKKNAYPKILPVRPEQIKDEEDLSQPPTIDQAAVPDLPFSDINQPTTPCAVQAAVPDLPFSDLSQPSTTCAVKPVQSVQYPSISETPREHKLRKTVLVLKSKLNKTKRKIKTLNQKVRRLKQRNKSLEELLEVLRACNTPP